MKRLAKLIGLLGLAGVAFAGPSSPPAGNYLLNVSTLVASPAYNVSSGTVRTQLKLTYGTTGQLIYLSPAGVVTTTTTLPTGGDVFKNSANAFSALNTFGSSTTFNHQVRVQTTGAGQGTGAGGSILVYATDDTGMPFQIYTSSANQAGYFGLVNLIASNTNYANAMIYITGTSSSSAKADIYVSNPRPNIQLYQTGGASPYGQFEFVVVGDTLQFNAMNTGGSAQKARLGMTHPGALAFYETTDNGHFVALKSSATISSNVTWVLPAADGSANQVLATNGAGVLSWVTQSGSGGGGGLALQPSTATITISSGLAFSGDAGTAGQILASQGASTVPHWITASGVGDAVLASTQTFSGVDTFTQQINIAGTVPILSTNSLQSGTTFFVPYGDVATQLLIGTAGSPGSDSIRIQPSLLTYYSGFATLNPYLTLKFSNSNTGALRAGLSFCAGDSCTGSNGYGSRVMLIGTTAITMTRTVNISSATVLTGELMISSGVALSGSEGTNGQVLTSGGGGAIPTWTTPPSGGMTPGNTDYIQVRSTLQSGATFYVSSGTVDTQLNIASQLYMNNGSSITNNSSTLPIYLNSPNYGRLQLNGTDSGIGLRYAELGYDRLVLRNPVAGSGNGNWTIGRSLDLGYSDVAFNADGVGCTDLSGTCQGAVVYLYGRSAFAVDSSTRVTIRGNIQSNSALSVGGPTLIGTGYGDEGSMPNNGLRVMGQGIFASSLTVSGLGGLEVTYTVNAASMTGAGLATCGDSTHGLGYSAGLFTCQNITGTGGGGGSSALEIVAGLVRSSPTATVNFPAPIFRGSVSGSSMTVTVDGSSATLRGQVWSQQVDSQFLSVETDTTTIFNAFKPRLDNLDSSTATITTNYKAVDANVAISTASIGVSTGAIAGILNGKLGVSSITATAPTLYSAGVISFSQQVAQPETFTSSVTHNNAFGIVNTASLISLNVSTVPTGVSQLSVSSSPAVLASDFVLTVASASTAMLLGVQNNSHVISSGTAPTVTSCGATPNGSVDGTDFAGVITVGGGVVTSCKLVFSAPFGNGRTPVCVVVDNSTTVSASLGTITVTDATFNTSATLGGGLLYYICAGNKG